MPKQLTLVIILHLLISSMLFLNRGLCQTDEINYDESKVPFYRLPDALVLENGEQVSDSNIWMTQRRIEILKLFEKYVYGKAPEKATPLSEDNRGRNL